MSVLVTAECLSAGTLLISLNGPRLARVERAGRINGASGYFVSDWTGDPETDYSIPIFCPDYIAERRVAIIGKTVCPEPYGTHWCGLRHLIPGELAYLTS